jgi:hypothetical protein
MITKRRRLPAFAHAKRPPERPTPRSRTLERAPTLVVGLAPPPRPRKPRSEPRAGAPRSPRKPR